MARPLAALAALIIALSLYALLRGPHGSYRLHNGSKRVILKARVKVCGQESTLGPLPPGGTASATFRPTGDSGYDVSVEWEGGGKLDATAGYVTNGMDFDDTIEVSDSGVKLSTDRQK